MHPAVLEALGIPANAPVEQIAFYKELQRHMTVHLMRYMEHHVPALSISISKQHNRKRLLQQAHPEMEPTGEFAELYELYKNDIRGACHGLEKAWLSMPQTLKC